MEKITKVFLASDHAGVQMKKTLVENLKKEFQGLEVVDHGPSDESRVDYPDFAKKVAESVASDKNARGLLICGSGIGMAISANKVQGIRAASVWDETSARLCRQHNSANIACFGARLTGPDVILQAAKVFLTTAFEGGRHEGRVQKISALER